MSFDLSEYLDMFRDEAAEYLSRLSEGLIALEQRPDDAELIHDLFRAAHSLKGSAHMMELVDVADVAHHLEDVLDDLRARRTKLDPSLADALLKGVDALADLVGRPGSPEGFAVAADTVAMLSAARTQVPQPPPVMADAAATAQEAATPSATGSTATRVSVPIDRLDRMLQLSAELVTRLEDERRRARDLRMLDRLLSSAEAELGRFTVSGQALRPLREARETLERMVRSASRAGTDSLVLAEELYEQASRARMVPAETLFGRLQRAARDAQQETGKQVRVEVQGADTVLDKRLLDDLHDPLLHLVRNAVDHGIEPVDLRAARGKPLHGTIRLAAVPSGDHAVVEISDDGAGLNPDLFRATAVRRGLMDEAEAAALTDDAAVNLMFRPGFSTREATTALSGRGVGMDVVKTAVEGLNGHIAVHSQASEGTRFVLTLPLNVATLRVLLVRASDQTFALPTSAVDRCTWLFAAGLRDEAHADVDGEHLELRVLSRLLGPGAPHPGPCVILRDGQAQLALLVDAILGETAVVVETLGPLLHDIQSVTGGALLHNGQVALALSVPYLFWETTPAAR